MNEKKKENKYHCSFCDKSQDEAVYMVAGPHNICICDECIGLCCEIGFERMRKEGNK